MEILTDKELDFLKEEAKKIKAIDYLKEIAKKHDLLFPDSNKPEEKKRLLEDHNRRKKATNKAVKLVSRVDIDIVEEGIYEPKDQTLKKEYCVLTRIICKSSDPEDQIFTEVTLGSGINFFLSYTIEQILQDRLDNYRITEAENRKKAKFKKPGHLVDQILKVAPRESTTLDLFSELSEEIKSELQKEKVEISRELFSGINLTASEMKIQDTFSILLSQQSQTEDPEKPNYYTGAKPETVPSFLGGKGAIAPSIEFSLYTIAKEFKGGKTPTGKDLENVKKILQELEKKKFLIRHTEIYSKRGGGKATLERDGYRTLFHLDKVTLTEEDKNGKQTNKAETMVVVLSPLYRQQIESKFILQPLDIIQQLTLANGSPNIPLATYNLKEYLFRELSSKHYECKITARKLYETLEPKLMQVPRIKQAKENTNRAINTLLSLGLLERYETGTSKVGEAMFTFYLNKNY
jgi:hypothetical protein